MCFRLRRFRVSKAFCHKTGVPASHLFSGVISSNFLKAPKIILQLLSELIHRQLVLSSAVITVGLVHRVSRFQRGRILVLKYHVAVFHKVKEEVGLVHHLDRPVSSVIILSQFPIHIQAVLCDCAEFKVDLIHQSKISFGRDLLVRRFHIDQSADDARLGIGDLYRLVAGHKQKAVRPCGIAGLVLLIHGHQFVRDNGVQLRVILNFRQIAIMLNGYQRV